jgi:hypothetical protein
MKAHVEQYRTAFGDTIEGLDRKVNELIAEGFQPWGSPYFIGATEGNVDAPICQAMTKCAHVPTDERPTSDQHIVKVFERFGETELLQAFAKSKGITVEEFLARAKKSQP